MAPSPLAGSPPASSRVPHFAIRRPASSDSLPHARPSRHLRSSSSTSSLGSQRGLPSMNALASSRRSVAGKGDPTLEQLMLEEQQEQMRVETRSKARGRRRSSAIDGVGYEDEEEGRAEWASLWSQPPPESADLHPPLYGRPGPSHSPDIFTTLLQPILALSRPASPSASPSTSSSTFGPVSSIEEPADRSASSLPAQFPPRASTDPAPTVESQGFVLYLGSLVAWTVFLIWGLCPDEWLEWMGIEWYPSREWALLFPAWTIMLAAFVYFSYVALNIFITPPLDSLHTLTDHNAYSLPFPTAVDGERPLHPLLANSIFLPDDAVPPLHDLPIGLVNRVVFGDHRRKEPKVREARQRRNGESASTGTAPLDT